MAEIKYDIKIAVVILNWNGKKHLAEFLPSVIRHSKSEQIKIYIADNGSSDDSVSFIRNNFPDIELILLDKNYGFAEGYNKALTNIQAEYYVILNSDVELSANWLFPVIEKMDTDLSVGAAMPKIKSYHDKDYFEYAGAAGGFIDKLGYPFCRGRILDTIEKDEGQYDQESEIFWASGACLFIRSKVYHQQGGFDSDFFAHMEEIDLCWRIKNTGFKIMYYPDSEVFHLGGGALPNGSPRKLYLNYRNNLLMLFKNLSGSKLIFVLFFRMVLDGMSAMVYLLKFQFSNFFAVLKAHLSFYYLLPKFSVKRHAIKNKYRNHKGQFSKSIIYYYFIKNKHHFFELKQ